MTQHVAPPQGRRIIVQEVHGFTRPERLALGQHLMSPNELAMLVFRRDLHRKRLQRRYDIKLFRERFHRDMAAFEAQLALLMQAEAQRQRGYQRRYDPAQLRDAIGRWTATGGGGSSGGAQVAQDASSSGTMSDAQEEPLLGDPVTEVENPELAQMRRPPPASSPFPAASFARQGEYVATQAQAQNAIARARMIDPTYQPQSASLFGSIDGAIAHNRALEAEANAFVMRGGRADLMPQGQPLGQFLRPGGSLIGERGQAGIRIVSEAEFWPLVGNVTAGARQLPAPSPSYQGVWLQRLDQSLVTLRYSNQNSWPLGVENHRSFMPTLPAKVHYSWP